MLKQPKKLFLKTGLQYSHAHKYKTQWHVVANLPFSYNTFFIEVLFGLSFSCSERSWISSIVGFNTDKLLVLSETISAADLGLGTSLIISCDWHFILFCFLVNKNDNLKWNEDSS